MRKKIKFGISINETLCGIYMLAVWSIYLFVHYYSGKEDKLKFAGLFLLCAVAAFGVSKCVLTWLRRLPAVQNAEITRKRKIRLYCIFFLISLGILCLWYAAYYPGAYTPDSINQYEQALTGHYSDWHPVWHTLLFFSLPLALTGSLGSIVFFQIVYFALVLAYLGLTVYEFAGRKAAVFALAYILVNPYTGYIAVYPWKDVAMAVTLLWAMIYVARLYCTDGKWAMKNQGGGSNARCSSRQRYAFQT